MTTMTVAKAAITGPIEALQRLEASYLTSAPPHRAKSCLIEESGRILEQFQEATTGTCTLSGAALIAAYNNAGLILFHSGRPHMARMLTDAALQICADEHRRTNSSEWIALMLQPYVNTGRLLGACGNAALALSHFRSVYDYACKDKKLVIRDAELDPQYRKEMENEIREGFTLQAFASNVYVGDSIKALLAAGEAEQLVAFCDEGLCDPTLIAANPRLEAVLLEGKAKGLLELGRAEDSLKVLKRIVSMIRNSPVAILGIYALIAEAFALLGNDTASREAIEYAELKLQDAPRSESLALHRGQTHYLLAQAWIRRMQHTQAQSCLEESARACREARHEVGLLKTLATQLYIDPGQTEVRGELENLLDHTQYLVERSTIAMSIEADDSLDRRSRAVADLQMAADSGLAIARWLLSRASTLRQHDASTPLDASLDQLYERLLHFAQVAGNHGPLSS